MWTGNWFCTKEHGGGCKQPTKSELEARGRDPKQERRLLLVNKTLIRILPILSMSGIATPSILAATV